MPRIKISLGIGLQGRREDFHDYPDEEWDALTDEQKERELEQLAADFIANYVDCAAWGIE